MVSLGVLLQDALQGPHCSEIRITGSPFHSTGVSFVLPRRSPITQYLSNATLLLRDTDNIPTPERFLSGEGSCNESDFEPISFIKLIWFFVLVFLAIAFVLLLMALAACNSRRARMRERAASEG